MRILDRYIVREFLGVFVFSLAIFIALSAIVDLFDRLSRFFDVSGMVVIQYYMNRLPWFGFQVLPVAVLLAALFSLGKMARYNELLAMKMGRLNSFRIVVPLLVLGLVVSFAALILGESIIPRMNERALNAYRVKVQKVAPFQRTKDNDIWYRAKGNRFLHISLLDTTSGNIRGLTLFELSPDFALLRRIDAREARWQNGQWLLQDGEISWTGPDGTYRVNSFTNFTLYLDEKPIDLAQVMRESEEMSSGELREYIEKLAKTGANSVRYQVDLAAKGSTAFSSLVMALIGIAFALRTGKRGVMTWTGACVVVAICYSILNSFSISLGRGGVLSPVVAAWLPNALFTAAGLGSVLRVKS
ncbi:LPS export ABC transporter permease LptG [Candidatus Methylomirabilis sp.]|uniref:LPS export ABC transporter permease LptG n=1 Tax=Candidatus Methylomirabilis tolerans TaxID=3123416 RepID=A0AAJ1EJ68_9BACT|nr:LPS export ABC transporter permease LptG [Candidatus Methylomirabilis sp.]